MKCAVPQFVKIAVIRADLIDAFQHALHEREVFPGGTQCRKPGQARFELQTGFHDFQQIGLLY
ncbi:hypothetical protein D3C86_1847190 [compost metagenome]